jgi:hypothetical protein
MATTVLLAIGILLVLAGRILHANFGGAADFVIKNMTSRSLRSLAPGYAASSSGFKVYSHLLVAIGMALIGLGLLDWQGYFGEIFVLVGIVYFMTFSVVAIVGEVRTYRALKR